MNRNRGRFVRRSARGRVAMMLVVSIAAATGGSGLGRAQATLSPTTTTVQSPVVPEPGNPAPVPSAGDASNVPASDVVAASAAVPSAATSPELSPSAGPGEYSAPEWWPLRGENLIGCTRNSPDRPGGSTVCEGDYHPVWAIDVEAAEGQPIYAAGSGLAKVYSDRTDCVSYGRAVVVEHGGTTKSLYAHMSNFSSALIANPGGVWVDANTVIGYVGHTGNVSRCTYNHLHYEETTGGSFWSGASDPGSTRGCIGNELVSYPESFGAASWDRLQGHTYRARHDGMGCVGGTPWLEAPGPATWAGSARQDGLSTFTYPLRNAGNGSFSAAQVVVTVEAPSGQVSNVACAGGAPLTIAAGASWTCQAHVIFNELGSHRVYLRWQLPDGSWSTGAPYFIGIWGWEQFTISVGSIQGITSDVGANDPRVGHGTHFLYTVRNDANRAITIPWIGVGVVDPDGSTRDIACSGGTNLALASSATFLCDALVPYQQAGTHTIDLKYRRPAGAWYGGPPVFTVPFFWHVSRVATSYSLTNSSYSTQGRAGDTINGQFTIVNDGEGAGRLVPTVQSEGATTSSSGCGGADYEEVILEPGESFTCRWEATLGGGGRATFRTLIGELPYPGTSLTFIGWPLSDIVLADFDISAAVVPGAPTDVVTVLRPYTTTVSVSFTPPVDDGGAPITGYEVACYAAPSGTFRSATGTSSPVVVSGLDRSAFYYCYPRARNAVGQGPFTDPVPWVYVPPAHAKVTDFDGDGATDRGVFRNGAWYVGGQSPSYLGLNGDIPVPGDYDGNGTTDRAVFRNGAWYIEGQATRYLGAAADIPVPGDYDGNGTTDLAVYRNGAWYIDGQTTRFLGVGGDIPVPGDYDGNGTVDPAVYRNGTWYIGGQGPNYHGLASDVPAPADYDGNGTTDVAVYRQSVGGWYVVGMDPVFYGLSTDVPVPGDYDGDGTADRAVYRPAVGGWYVEGATTQYLGLANDVPLPLPHAIRSKRY